MCRQGEIKRQKWMRFKKGAKILSLNVSNKRSSRGGFDTSRDRGNKKIK